MVKYFYLITVLPLVGFLINGLFGVKIRNEKVSGIIGSLMVLGSFVMSILAYMELTALPEEARSITIPLFNWITSGSLNIGAAYLVDTAIGYNVFDHNRGRISYPRLRNRLYAR